MNARVREAVRALSAYEPGEQPDDPDVLKLNTNENPYPPSPAVARVLKETDAQRLALYPDPVSRGLRDSLARLHACSAEQIVVGNGSDEILALCLRAFVEQGAGVGYFDPSYSVYPVLVDIHGGTKKPTALADDFSWTPPDGEGLSLFFLTNPNAPTSRLFPKEEVEAFCRSFDGVVVIDEAYVDFSREDCVDLALQLPNVLVARTVSKAYSLAGIRLGYAVGSKNMVDALFKVKDSYNVSGLTQALAKAAVEDQEHLEQNLARIMETRDRAAAALRERGFDVFPSDTNFLWARPTASSAEDLFAALREKKVLVRHFPSEKTRAYLRITVGTDRQMDRFIATLDAIL